MADIQINPLGNVKAPDITGPVQVGFGIAQGRQRAQREQQKIDAAKEQLIVENARLADAAKEASNERMFNSGIALLNVSKSRNNVDMGKEGVRMLFKSMGVDDKISNGINVTQEMVDDAIAIGKAKDGSPEEEIEENIFMEKYKIALSDFLATQSGEFSGLEAAGKEQKEIAKEERALKSSIELARAKSGFQTLEDVAKIKAAGKVTGAVKIENKEFFNEAGAGQFVNINDPIAIKAAEVLGFKPKKEKKEKEKEFKPIFLQGKLTSGKIDTVTIDRNAADAFSQTQRLLSFGYAPVKDPNDPVARFGLQDIRTPAGGPLPPVGQPTDAPIAGAEIEQDIEEGPIETKAERVKRLKKVSSRLNVDDLPAFNLWVDRTNRLRKLRGELLLDPTDPLDRKEFNSRK